MAMLRNRLAAIDEYRRCICRREKFALIVTENNQGIELRRPDVQSQPVECALRRCGLLTVDVFRELIKHRLRLQCDELLELPPFARCVGECADTPVDEGAVLP